MKAFFKTMAPIDWRVLKIAGVILLLASMKSLPGYFADSLMRSVEAAVARP